MIEAMGDFGKIFRDLGRGPGVWAATCGRRVVWMVAAVMTWMAAACGGGGTAGDARLLAVDSIVDTDSVAAWRQLQAIDSATLSTDADHMLYTLLHQQLRYKQYLPLDTARLARLREYYNANPDGNRLARAMVLTGGACEDAGQPTDAIAWYKRAESEAIKCDATFLLAFAKFRMAKVYNAAYTQDSTHIIKFKEAAPLFRAAGARAYECESLKETGAAYRSRNADSAYHYLSRALDLSRELCDTAQIYDNLSLLAGYYYCIEDYSRCKDLAVDILAQGCQWLRPHTLNATYNNAAFSYAKLGKTDSALYYNRAKPASPQAGLDQMNYFHTLSLIAQAEGNADEYIRYNLAEDEISDSILLASKQGEIKAAEAKYDLSQAELNATRSRLMLVIAMLVLAVMALCIAFLLFRQQQRAKAFALEIELLHDELAHSAAKLEETHQAHAMPHTGDPVADGDSELKETRQANAALRGMARAYLNSIRDYLEAYYNFNHNTKQFTSYFKTQVNKFVNDEEFWSNLRKYLDNTYDGLITNLERQQPKLTDVDVKFICLDCCDFPPGVIMLLMGYTNSHSVENRRYVIARRLGYKIKDLVMNKLTSGNQGPGETRL